MSSSFPFVPYISVLCYICCHLLYWGSSTSVYPLCSLSVYTFRLASDWLGASTVMPNFKCFLGLLTAAHLFLLLPKGSVFYLWFQRNTAVVTFLQTYAINNIKKIVRYLDSNRSLFWWTTEKETEVFQQIATVSVTWKRMNYETKCATLHNYYTPCISNINNFPL